MARHASIGDSCWSHKLLLNPSNSLFELDAALWVKRREPNRLFRPQSSLSKRLRTRLPSTWNTWNCPKRGDFCCVWKTTHGTFIGARAHKYSAFERLSCLQSESVFLRLLNARCFMIHFDTLALKGLSSARLMHWAGGVETSNARVPRNEPQKRTYFDTNELLLGRTCREPQKSKTERWTSTREYEFAHELLRGWN